MRSRRSSMSLTGGTPVAGRPRSARVDVAILRAAKELLASVGPDATTINAVARRSGVARASIYLRYPNRDALLAAAIRAAIGRPPIPITGNLVEDLHRGAQQARAVLASKPFQALLPNLIAGLLRPRSKPQAITYAMLAPHRGLIADEYRSLASDAGLRSDADADLVVDLIIGGVLNHLLVTGSVPSASTTRQAVEILLDGLRAR